MKPRRTLGYETSIITPNADSRHSPESNNAKACTAKNKDAIIQPDNAHNLLYQTARKRRRTNYDKQAHIELTRPELKALHTLWEVGSYTTTDIKHEATYLNPTMMELTRELFDCEIAHLLINKAPGPDGVRNEWIKEALEWVHECLFK